mmetsp:Transcript_59603/g.189664  ORF Transcript_59603/g.189664 Transcript_59603/m.189664 type:complete len:664 (+) Transcript_59603:14-2005(+)
MRFIHFPEYNFFPASCHMTPRSQDRGSCMSATRRTRREQPLVQHPHTCMTYLPPSPWHLELGARARGTVPELGPLPRAAGEVFARLEEPPVGGGHPRRKRLQRRHDLARPDGVGPLDEPTAPGREAHRKHARHVQVGCLLHHPLRQHPAALVHHGEEHHSDDLLRPQLGGRAPAPEARGRPGLGQDGRDGGVRGGLAARVVLVEALAALLPQPLGVVEREDESAAVAPLREVPDEVRAHVLGYVRTHQVAQPERAHGHPEHLVDDLVDSVGVQAHVHEHAGAHGVGEEDPVHREACAVANYHRHLLDCLGQPEAVQDHLRGGLGRADDLEQRHDVRGGEEVRAHDAGGISHLARADVDVDGGGVRGEDAVRAASVLEVLEDPLLERDVLDHRLDHHVARPELRVVQGALHQPQHLLGRLGLHGALLDAALQVGGDPCQPPVEELLVDLLEEHADAREGECSADAAAHEPPPDHPHALEGPGGQALVRHPADLRGGPLGQEDVHQRARHVRHDAVLEHLLLLLEASRTPVLHARLDGIDAHVRVLQVAGRLLGLCARPLDDHLRRAQVLQPVRPEERVVAGHAAGGNVERELSRLGEEGLAVDDPVDEAPLEGLLGLDGLGRQHHLEALLQADEAGEALRAAEPGDDSQAELGQAEHGVGEGES